MLKHLINLADYLDTKQQDKFATLVDAFIARAALTETTWMEDEAPDYTGDFEFIPETSEDESPTVINVSNNVSLDLENNPLGKMVLEFINKCFQMADDGITDMVVVNVADLTKLVSTFSRYDENLNYDKRQTHSMPPIQVKFILNEAMQLVYKIYVPQGRLNLKEIVESVDNLYKQYEDFYLTRYMNEPSAATTQMDMDPRNVVLPELSEKDRRDLWERQDNFESNESAANWLEQVEREESPEKYQRRLNQRKREDQRGVPEEWHHLLFDK